MNIYFTKIACAIIAITTTGGAMAQGTLQKNFTTPPDSIKPSIYYYWLSDNISAEGVKKDIEAMAKVGIGRAFIGNIGLDETPSGHTKMFTDEWWNVVRTAMKTARENGIDIGMFNSPGWSQSGGPWVKPTESMRYLYSQEWPVTGGRQIAQKLPITKKDFQPVVTLAFKQPYAEADLISTHKPIVTSTPAVAGIAAVADGDTATAALFPADDSLVTIDITTTDTFTARSLLLYTATKPIKSNVALLAKAGDNYRLIRSFQIDRSNPALNVGFEPYAPICISFDAVKSSAFRITFSAIEGNSGIAELQLSAAPRVERFAEKKLAKMFQTPLPLWNEYQWPVQAEPKDNALIVQPAEVIDVSKYISADGTLNWTAPAGNWIVVRYGMVSTGVTNSPATAEGRGLEVDKINKDALVNLFNSYIANIQQRIPAEDRKAFKYVVADSYETGSQNWTDGMIGKFKTQFGYDPTPYLPALTGRIVGSADQSNRFLWDLRRMIADKVAYEYVGGLRDISHQHGLSIWLENYGHWGYPSEFLKYGGQTDEIGGEFWNEGTLGNIECRAASSAAHIYGKRKVSAESFTAGGLAYVRYPALLKKRGDWSFTEGINNTLLHVFVEQPYENRNPGVNAGFGTEFNRKNTWFFEGKAFFDYLRRCNYLLQLGRPVDDVAYFIGEDAPKMTGIRDPELPKGYQFDYINAEVIETRLAVKDGRLVLPDGMSYGLLVLPPLTTMRPALIKKIQQLVNDGATILGPAPTRSPSLQNFPAADEEVKQTAETLWGTGDGKSPSSTKVGKGSVLAGMTMQQALGQLNIKPDFSVDSAVNVLYTHRTTDSTEFYFITNQMDSIIHFNASFRFAGEPEWWDAVTGAVRPLPQFSNEGRSTKIGITLEPYQSGFVVFHKRAIAKTAGSSAENFPQAKKIMTLDKSWTVRFDTAMRGPQRPVFLRSLIDWSKSANDSIKNYSGKATYQTSFTIVSVARDAKVFLNLGDVKVIAVVKLNGKSVGTVWTAPWQIDITHALKSGVNKLEVVVVNTWVNRLIGDSKLPEAERKTWTSVNPYQPDSPYQSAGLLGPVTLQLVKY